MQQQPLCLIANPTEDLSFSLAPLTYCVATNDYKCVLTTSMATTASSSDIITT